MIDSIYNDPLNRNHERSFENTDRAFFNCAGYALSTFSWYIPVTNKLLDLWELFEESGIGDLDEDDILITSLYDRIISIVINTLSTDFVDRHLKLIQKISDANLETQDVIAFRTNLTDFHFIKYEKDNLWTEKRGFESHIYNQTTDYVLNSTFWKGNYNSDTILFAIDKINIKE